MRYFVLCLTVLATACGSSLLDPGKYKVDITYTHDDWPNSLEGQTTEATWIVSEDDGKYKLDVVDGSQDLPGKEKNNMVVFEKNKVDLHGQACDMGQTFLLEVTPNENGDKFTGYGKVTVSFGSFRPSTDTSDEICNVIWLVTEATMTGKKED